MSAKRIIDYTLTDFESFILNDSNVDTKVFIENIKQNANGNIMKYYLTLLVIYNLLYEEKESYELLNNQVGGILRDISNAPTIDKYLIDGVGSNPSVVSRNIINQDNEIKNKTIGDILNLIKDGYCNQKGKISVKDIINTVFGEEVDRAMAEAKVNDSREQITRWIEDGATQIILTGAPGTGKTRLAKEIAKDMGAKITWKEDKNKCDVKYELVQFHPSYDYTDFIEGLRPVEVENDGKDDKEKRIEFQKLDGTFKRFCRFVAERNVSEGNHNQKYFFIIDEINRADLSKVFGELMYCLESDKRGVDNKIQTQYQNLATYFTKADEEQIAKIRGNNAKLDIFGDGFYIPENIIIIGTMNDIDRSVESMDFALRRRFLWHEIKVTSELLEASLGDVLTSEGEGAGKLNYEIIKEIAERVNGLNENVIRNEPGLGEHFYISQGQFANLPESILNILKDNDLQKIDKFMEKVFELRLRPLLYEYVRGEGKENVFIEKCKLGIKKNKGK